MVRREASTQLAIYIRCKESKKERKGKTKRKFYVYFTHLTNNNRHFEFEMVNEQLHFAVVFFFCFFLPDRV